MHIAFLKDISTQENFKRNMNFFNVGLYCEWVTSKPWKFEIRESGSETTSEKVFKFGELYICHNAILLFQCSLELTPPATLS